MVFNKQVATCKNLATSFNVYHKCTALQHFLQDLLCFQVVDKWCWSHTWNTYVIVSSSHKTLLSNTCFFPDKETKHRALKIASHGHKADKLWSWDSKSTNLTLEPGNYQEYKKWKLKKTCFMVTNTSTSKTNNHPRNTETEEAIFSNTQKDRRQVE